MQTESEYDDFGNYIGPEIADSDVSGVLNPSAPAAVRAWLLQLCLSKCGLVPAPIAARCVSVSPWSVVI